MPTETMRRAPAHKVRRPVYWFRCAVCGHKVGSEVEGVTAYCWHKGTPHASGRARRMVNG